MVWILGAVSHVWVFNEYRDVLGEFDNYRYLSLAFAIVGIFRIGQALRNYQFRARLTTPRSPNMLQTAVLDVQKKTKHVFLGYGFTWQPMHAGLVKEISGLSDKTIINPPRAYVTIARWLGLIAKTPDLEGDHALHGVAPAERKVLVTKQSRRTHTLVLGTNGAGKTRLLELLVAQAISCGRPAKNDQGRTWKTGDTPPVEHRWSPVFILDPKGDLDLRDRAYSVALELGRHENFYTFTPSDVVGSVLLDPFKRFKRASELTNRIIALLPSGGESEAFKAFSWRAVTVILDGIIMARKEVSLLTLRDYIQGGVDPLFEACFDIYIDRIKDEVGYTESAIKTEMGRIRGDDDRSRRLAKAAFYKKAVAEKHPDLVIDALIDILTHDREHYNKLIANLIPIMIQLTAKPMDTLLSGAKHAGVHRTRESFEEMIRSGSICYVNLQSLADSTIGSALGSLFLADLTACAADRHAAGISDPPVSIFVDEAAEMMNDPFIQALNKGRSAGFELTLASQTTADFEARMGSRAKALQVLGNINTWIAMRLQDKSSIDTVVDKFSETAFETQNDSRTSTTINAIEQRGRDYSGAIMHGSQQTDITLVTGEMLSSLPPGQYFALLPGGERIKGRVPMMEDLESDRRFSKPSPFVLEESFSEHILQDGASVDQEWVIPPSHITSNRLGRYSMPEDVFDPS